MSCRLWVIDHESQTKLSNLFASQQARPAQLRGVSGCAVVQSLPVLSVCAVVQSPPVVAVCAVVQSLTLLSVRAVMQSLPLLSVCAVLQHLPLLSVCAVMQSMPLLSVCAKVRSSTSVFCPSVGARLMSHRDCRGWRLVVTGHSLGAGASVLVALYLRNFFPK